MTDIDALEALAKATAPGYALTASPVVILDLVAEVRALREDAERFDWIDLIKPIVFHPSWDGDVWTLAVVQFEYVGNTLREAIDAAREDSQ
jgi:hypothetical protein